MFFSRTSVKIQGFSDSELITISAKSIHDLAFDYAQKTQKVIKQALAERLKKGTSKKPLTSALSDFEVIKNIAAKGTLTIEGVNYPQRYIEALEGFAKGSGLSLGETAFLQKEIDAGCQTLISKNQSGEIAFLHTEEDGNNDRLAEPAKYGHRLVKLNLNGSKAVFFSYPGLCLWGPAFGFKDNGNFVQFADELFIKEKYYGPLWANFIVFMFFDCGDVSKITLLAKKLKVLAVHYPVHNGYSVHMLDSKKLTAVSFELAGSKVVKIATDYKNFVQVNYPKTKELHKLSEYDEQTYLEMTRREKRLEKIADLGIWQIDSQKNAVETGLKTLAYPYGDLRRYRRKDKRWAVYHTGLPSLWTAAHFVGFLGKKTKQLHIGKLTPKPIEDMAYSNQIDDTYKYQEKKIWEMTKNKKRS